MREKKVIADQANAILKEEIAKLETVYGHENMVHGSSPVRSRHDTHQTKILPPQEIEG